ncbi:aldose 1-epimerase [bacterium A37T11]|nr:aldose 1-epimerase [bacterium A37T11]
MNNDTTISKGSIRLWDMHQGKEIYLFHLLNKEGRFVVLTNYGASLVSAVVPDRTGLLGNVVLGFDSLDGYLDDTCYVGATIGRFANRIAHARFTMDGRQIQLDANDGLHSNHGGFHGFHRQVFGYKVLECGLCFEWESKDGEGGYPGDLSLRVCYQWTDDSELKIDYTASSDKDTVANFTNHAYFNLTAGHQPILEHSLTIFAEQILEDSPGYIPTGAIIPAGDKAFRGGKIREQIPGTGHPIEGINLCYALPGGAQPRPRLAAVLADKISGRRLEISTTYPGLLLYTGDLLQSRLSGHHGVPYGPFDGLCLECQYFPDSPNHPTFPSTILKAGEIYHEQIVYKFCIEPVAADK